MNSGRRAAVEPIMVLVLALGGCVEVEGGAVELSWAIRTTDGKAASCAYHPDRPITEVGLCVGDCDMLLGGACSGPVVCPVATWSCDRLHGTTGFDLAPGRKQLHLSLECGTTACPSEVLVPEPVVRDVREGEVTQLNALLITVPSAGSKPSPESLVNGSKEEPQ